MTAGDDNRWLQPPLHPGRILALLTGLNFLNYLDRYIFFGVQPLIQAEFHRSDAQMGLVTSAFFFVYMFTAPATGYFGDRYSRKRIMVGGALLWSAATLLTALTHSFQTLLLRHVMVGLGEATFVVIAPAYLADLYPEARRGRMLSLFYLALPCGSALGYMVGGYLGYHFGWRTPFYVAGVPGALIAIALIFTTEPVRGRSDLIAATPERATLMGLKRNGAFWMASLGLAMITFALGGFSAWMPTFFNRSRGLRWIRRTSSSEASWWWQDFSPRCSAGGRGTCCCAAPLHLTTWFQRWAWWWRCPPPWWPSTRADG